MIPSYGVALLALLACQAAAAGTLYKWVDASGRVTYSSSPPPAGAAAEKLPPVLAPTEAEVRDAEERLRQMAERADELENARLEQEMREASETLLREAQEPQPPIVIEKRVYVPQPLYYPRVIRPPHRRDGGTPPWRPPLHPLPLPRPQRRG